MVDSRGNQAPSLGVVQSRLINITKDNKTKTYSYKSQYHRCLYQVEKFPYTFNSLLVFVINGYLTNAFSSSIEIIIFFSPLLCQNGKLQQMISHLKPTVHFWIIPRYDILLYMYVARLIFLKFC